MIFYNDFLENYEKLKSFSKTCLFEDEVNPIDGVVYPDICKDVPKIIKDEVFDKLSTIIKKPIDSPTIFLRMSKSGVPVPHPVHHDLSMGKYSFMLYLNTAPGGTALVRHRETGIMYAPESQEYAELMRADQSDLSKWAKWEGFEMQENRGALFDAGFFHVAEPVGGFGDSQDNARIVLTCFFS